MLKATVSNRSSINYKVGPLRLKRAHREMEKMKENGLQPFLCKP